MRDALALKERGQEGILKVKPGGESGGTSSAISKLYYLTQQTYKPKKAN